MKQIDVCLEFDEQDDEPTFYVSDDGKLKWPYDKVLAYDWKEERAQAKGYTKLRKKGEVVVLFDGSDSIMYANTKDAIKEKK
jgi:hypothetical protein